MIRWRAALLALALVVTGCAGNSNLADDTALLATDEEGLPPAAAELLHQAKRSAATRVTAAGLGAGAGLLGCLLATGNMRSAGGRAALVAGCTAAGGALGYAAGAYVDARNQAAGARQTDLRALTIAAQLDAEGYAERGRFAASAIAESQQEVARLNREYAAGRVGVLAYAAQAKALGVTAQAVRSAGRESTDVLKVMQSDIMAARAQGQPTEPLEASYLQLQAENISLVAQYRALLQVVDSAPAGGPRQALAGAVR